MGLLPIVSKESATIKSRLHVKSERLPTFYMEDFSVMGLTVEDMDLAVAVLQPGGIAIERDATLTTARINGLDGMKEKRKPFDCSRGMRFWPYGPATSLRLKARVFLPFPERDNNRLIGLTSHGS